MDNPLSVIVVDDQAPFRLAARAVVRRTEGFKLVGEAANGIEAISLANSLHPDLVLMDINMPEMGGLEATRQIVAGHPGTIVFLCSTYDVNDLPEDARTSGARAYMHKEHFSPNTLRRLWDERDSGRFAS
ncbi:MAG: response regulator transcription factor [Acidimicrobiales bacterium]|jgi:DNA-binding NarL/FixJ family response regulator